MKHGSKRFRKTASKSKKFRKTVSKKTNKRTTKRTTKRNRITKRRMRRGGFSMLENWNLQKYADDAEIQEKLAYHFNEPMIVGNPSKTLSLLKGLSNQYSSINLLLKEIGVGELSKEEISQIKQSNVALKKFEDDAAKREEFKEKKLRDQEELKAKQKKERMERERQQEVRLNALAEAQFRNDYGMSREQWHSRNVGTSRSRNNMSYSERRGY